MRIRLKEWRELLNVSQEEGAKLLSVSLSTFQKYERKKNPIIPPTDKLCKIADLAGVTVDWLLSRTDSDNKSQSSDRPADEFCYIPRYDIRAAAGHGAFNGCESVKQHMAFRCDFIKNHIKANPSDLFIVTADGDSMEPVIHTGNILLCDKGRVGILREGIYLLRIGEMLLVKNIQALPGHKLKVYSINPSYSPLEIDLSSESDVEIIAQVIWIGKTII